MVVSTMTPSIHVAVRNQFHLVSNVRNEGPNITYSAQVIIMATMRRKAKTQQKMAMLGVLKHLRSRFAKNNLTLRKHVITLHMNLRS
jgi:hypothetical protein